MPQYLTESGASEVVKEYWKDVVVTLAQQEGVDPPRFPNHRYPDSLSPNGYNSVTINANYLYRQLTQMYNLSTKESRRRILSDIIDYLIRKNDSLNEGHKVEGFNVEKPLSAFTQEQYPTISLAYLIGMMKGLRGWDEYSFDAEIAFDALEANLVDMYKSKTGRDIE